MPSKKKLYREQTAKMNKDNDFEINEKSKLTSKSPYSLNSNSNSGIGMSNNSENLAAMYTEDSKEILLILFLVD